MKKLLAAGIVLAFSLFCVSAQVLDKSQTKNTSWAGFGSPVDGSPSFYGFTNTFQTRYDMGQFTLEAMLNWSLLPNYDNEGNVDNFRFGTSNLNPLSLKYGTRGDSRWAGTNTKLYLKETHVPTCSLQHYSQEPGHGNNPNVHRQMNGLGRYGIYIHSGILLSHKKNKIMPFAVTWMELETLVLSEVSQKEKYKYHIISLISGI